MSDKNPHPYFVYFNEVIGGLEHTYRIIGERGKYVAEKDGLVIAKVARYEVWEQEGGEPLSPQRRNACACNRRVPDQKPL